MSKKKDELKDRRRVAFAVISFVAIAVGTSLVLPELWRMRNYMDVAFFTTTVVLGLAIFVVGPVMRTSRVRRALRNRRQRRA